MITINDDDLPIVAAGKIITGEKPYKPTPLERVACTIISGNAHTADKIDMFSLQEIKEIVDYLLVYYNAQIELRESCGEGEK